MRVSVKMRFWLQTHLDSSHAQGIIHGVTSLAETTTIYLPYNGMRRTYTQMQMTTTTEAETTDVGIGSNEINSTPRRGGESVETLPYVIRIATLVQQQKHMVAIVV